MRSNAGVGSGESGRGAHEFVQYRSELRRLTTSTEERLKVTRSLKTILVVRFHGSVAERKVACCVRRLFQVGGVCAAIESLEGQLVGASLAGNRGLLAERFADPQLLDQYHDDDCKRCCKNDAQHAAQRAEG